MNTNNNTEGTSMKKCAKCQLEKPEHAIATRRVNDEVYRGQVCRECYHGMYSGDPSDPKVIDALLRDWENLSLTLEAPCAGSIA